MNPNLKSIFQPNQVLADSLLNDACEKLGFDSKQIRSQLKPGEIQKNILEHMFSLVEKAQEHSILAGAIAMWQLYRNSPTTVDDYLNVFRSYFRDDVLEFMEKHKEKLQSEIQYHKDFEISYFAAGTLIGSYLSRSSHDEEPLEIPQFCWLRIAVGEFCSRKNSSEKENLEFVIKTYHAISERRIVPASPTIFNQGFKAGSSASCMIYTIGDSLEDILQVMKEAGLASKNNAGLGIDFSGLRHSKIGRQGKGKGIVPLLKVWDDLSKYIDQGGRRPGAVTGSIRIHHLDAPEFIRMRDQVGESSTKVDQLTTSIMLSDLFMKRCREGKKWTLFCPKQTGNLNLLHGKEFEEAYVEYEQKAEIWARYKKYRALKELSNIQEKLTDSAELKSSETWSSGLYQQLCKEFEGAPVPEEVDSREFWANDIHDEICDMRIKTGMPYIIHGCNTNRKNNMDNVGPVRSMNLCQEITIPAIPEKETGSCNLTSLSLKAFVNTDKSFDFMKLGESTRHSVICLNQVIDESRNVSDKVRRSNENNRPIGIGVSGFGDMMNLLDMPVVDMEKLPKLTGFSEDGEPIYKFVDITQEAPDYSDDALKERVLNPEADRLNWMIWSCMYYNALWESKEEAKTHGPYPNFWTSHTAKGELQYHLWQNEEKATGRKYPFRLNPADPSVWGQSGTWDQLISEIKTYGLRNSLLLTCMPTATTAQIVDNCESTEFHMKNIYQRKVLTGDYPIVNFNMVDDLKQIGLWNVDIYNQVIANDGSILSLSEDNLNQNQKIKLRHIKEKYLAMREMPQKTIIQLTAQRQVFIDHSQSLNIYLKAPTKELLKAIDFYTWQMGLKTGMYYLRTGASGKALRIGEVAKNSQLTNIKSVSNEIKTNILEKSDEDMDKILETIGKAHEKFQTQELEIREEIIKKTLMSASRPEVCTMEEGCIVCQ